MKPENGSLDMPGLMRVQEMLRQRGMQFDRWPGALAENPDLTFAELPADLKWEAVAFAIYTELAHAENDLAEAKRELALLRKLSGVKLPGP
jgi:hypothetical protein